MAMKECQHGIEESGCSYCSRKAQAGAAGAGNRSAGVRSRQRLLDELCSVLGVARHVETPGSNPSRVFAAAAESASVPKRSMPKIGAAIAAKAGLEWGPGCDNRRHDVEATMVTAEGIANVRQALAILAERRQHKPVKQGP